MKKSVLLIACALLLVSQAYGLGLASDYFPDDTIPLAPGAFFEYRINIQNGGVRRLMLKFCWAILTILLT